MTEDICITTTGDLGKRSDDQRGNGTPGSEQIIEMMYWSVIHAEYEGDCQDEDLHSVEGG
jgi:hypothetical protein